MDDLPNKETLDALADLFLTNALAAPASPAHPAPTPSPSAPAAAPAPSSAPARDALLDQLDAPAPIRLPPKLRAAHMAGASRGGVSMAEAPPSMSASSARSPRSPGLAVSALAEPPRQPESATPAPLAVEAVFLGNLPGFSGPWLTQYAQFLTRRHGAVLVVQIDPARIDLELVAPGRDPRPLDHIDPPPLRLVSPDEHDPLPGPDANLARWIQRLLDTSQPRIGAVLLHFTDPTYPTLADKALTIPRWTVLCGAFDAAAVGAYRLLKQLVENLPAQPSALDNAPAAMPRRVGVMVMGSDEERSRAVARKISAAAASFLQTPLELVGWQKQMVPVNLKVLGGQSLDEPAIGDPWPAIASVLLSADPGLPETPLASKPPAAAAFEPPERFSTAQQIRQALGLDPAADDAESADPAFRAEAQALLRDDPLAVTPSPSVAASSRAWDESPAPVPGSFDEPSPFLGVEDESSSSVETPPVAPAMAGTRQPVAAVPPASSSARPSPSAPSEAAPGRKHRKPAVEADPDLSAFLLNPARTSLGGVTLQARCPRHPRIQLLLDQDGRLHLMRRHVGDHPDPANDHSLRAAIVDLIEARLWVREHLDLLQLSQRQCRFDLRAKPVLHLFTDQARLAAALVNRLGPHLRLHLLQQVHIGDQSTWFSTELN